MFDVAQSQQGDGRVAAGAPGLVPQQTSPTTTCGTPLDARESRIRRLRRGVKTGGTILGAAAAHRPGFRSLEPYLVTLTYAKPDAWEPGHLAQVTKTMRAWWERRGWPWLNLWVAEIQPKRLQRTGKAVIHYHLVVWLPAGAQAPKPDAMGWWPHGMSNRKRATSPIGYLLKYASKGGEHADKFPKGARIFGMAGLGEYRGQYTHTMRPEWLRARVGQGDKLRRCPGGGWVEVDTGEVHHSPWIVRLIGGVPWLFPRCCP